MVLIYLDLCSHSGKEKILWCWEGLGAGGEGDDRGWDGWMASLTWWAWIWVNSGSWWWTGRPGMLWFLGLQRVGHDWATELNWAIIIVILKIHILIYILKMISKKISYPLAVTFHFPSPSSVLSSH